MDDDGYIAVVDRKKDMIKTGGENVASREVEEAMFQHPAVAEVAVFGIPDPYWVEAVTAVVVAKPGATGHHRRAARALPRPTGPLQGARSTSSWSTCCPRTRAARSSSATCARRSTTSPRPTIAEPAR